jgi:hypothetical protein
MTPDPHQTPAQPATQAGHAAPAPGCPSCDAEFAAEARFCRNCGNKLESEVATEVAHGHLAAPSIPPPTPQGSGGERLLQASGLGCTTPDDLVDEAPVSPQQVTSQIDVCPCGRTLPADAIFCGGCGTRIGEPPIKFHLTQVLPNDRSRVRAPLEKEIVIGKAPECDLVIADDEYVSRRHARVFCRNGDVVVEDLGSSNGTCVRLRRSFALAPGDELLIGRTVFRLDQDPPPREERAQ